MNSKRYSYVLSGTLFVLFVLLIGAAVGGDYVLQKQSKKLTDLKVQSASTDAQQIQLKAAQAAITKYKDLNDLTRSVVPQDKDQAKTVREIITIADKNKIPIKSVNFQASTLGAKPAVPAPATTGTGGASGTAAAPAAAPAPSQLKAVDGIKGVYSLEIKVASVGSVPYQNLINFLDDLEHNRRTAHVTTIDLKPSPDRSKVGFELTLNAYVKP